MIPRRSALHAFPLALLLALLAACGGGGGGGSSTPTPPGAPTIGTATAGNGSITVAFTAPASTGSSAIIDYVVTCSAGGNSRSQSGTASPITVTGLSNGTSYNCTVAATNSAGAGAASSAVSATPRGAPGAPTIGTATAGNGSASIAFTAPGSDGGSPITGYMVSCTGGGATRTATGAASPISVTGLSNGTAYNCSVTATNVVGTSAASGQVQVSPTAGGAAYNTDGVLCSYTVSEFNSSASVNATASALWGCNPTRSLVANAIPNHAVGTFPNANNPNAIRTQSITATFPLRPAIVNANGTNAMVPGYAINGVKFEPGTGGTCDSANPPNCTALGGTGAWRMEALPPSSFNFGTDSNNAHVQPTGEYHYHGLPTGLITKLGKGTAMTLVGWSNDGFPIYARYGYTNANDATSPVKELASSWRIKATPDSGRPATSLYPMGSFLQDYEYVAGLGDLDQCNGRTGVTPEFPNGIYYYAITSTFPFVHRCLRGSTATGG
jgi:hypothetical protein